MLGDFHDWSGMEYIHPRLIVTRPEVASLLPETVVREHNVISQGVKGGVLTIVISDPNGFSVMDQLRFVLARAWRSGSPCPLDGGFRRRSSERMERLNYSEN